MTKFKANHTKILNPPPNVFWLCLTTSLLGSKGQVEWWPLRRNVFSWTNPAVPYPCPGPQDLSNYKNSVSMVKRKNASLKRDTRLLHTEGHWPSFLRGMERKMLLSSYILLCWVLGQNGSGQNGTNKMVYGQNVIGQNGMDKMVRIKRRQ